jgi:hypothetical protein
MAEVHRGPGRVVAVLLVVAAVAVVASATHAPHLPELLGGMHAPAPTEHGVMASPVDAAPSFARPDTAVQEVWCAVIALTPSTAQSPIPHTAAAIVLSLVLLAQPAWSPGSRTRPPSLRGARLRATLQVFRN